MSRSMNARRRNSKPGMPHRIKLAWNRGIGLIGRMVYNSEAGPAILVADENGERSYVPKNIVDARVRMEAAKTRAAANAEETA